MSEYRFLTRWHVRATVDEVAAILADPLDLPRWWPAVYLSATDLTARGVPTTARRVRLHTRGWLPYTLWWDLEVIRSNDPRRFGIAATGDLDGTGVWTLASRGDVVDVSFEWRVTPRKPLLRYLSPVLKPVFAANHRWAMRQGERSLRAEIARRRAQAAHP